MHRQSAQRCRGTGRTEHECDVRSGRKLGTEAETDRVLSEERRVKNEESYSFVALDFALHSSFFILHSSFLVLHSSFLVLHSSF